MSAILAAPPTRRKPARLGGMQPRAPIATDLVLLGAGHAHVEVLRRFAMRPEPGVRLTLIGREPETPYTGMLPGLIRGDYTLRAGAYRPGAARRQRRRATDPGRGDRHRPGGSPRRGDRASRRAVRPAVDRCRRRAGDAAGRRRCRSSRSGSSWRDCRRWRRRCRPARASPWSVAAPAGRNWRSPWRGATASGCGSCWCATRRSRWRRAPPFARSRRPRRAGRCRGGTGLRCAGRRLGRRQAGAVRRQLPGGRNRALGDGRGGTGVPRRLGPRLRRGRLRPGWTRRCAASVMASSSPPATVPPSRAIHGRSPASGRCAPARRWRPTCGAPRAGGRCAAGGRSRMRWRSSASATGVRWRGATASRSPGAPVWRWKDWIDRRWMRMYQEPMAPMAGG